MAIYLLSRRKRKRKNLHKTPLTIVVSTLAIALFFSWIVRKLNSIRPVSLKIANTRKRVRQMSTNSPTGEVEPLATIKIYIRRLMNGTRFSPSRLLPIRNRCTMNPLSRRKGRIPARITIIILPFDVLHQRNSWIVWILGSLRKRRVNRL